MLKSGGGSGRDVIFTLKAVADPASRQVFKQFADEMTKAQKQIIEASKPLVKKAADEKKKAEQEATLDIQKVYQKAELEDYRFRRDLQKKRILEEQRQESEFLKWRENVRKNSAVMENRENIRLAREAQQQMNRERILAMRRDRATDRAWDSVLGGVGHIARGAAYSGLVGEQNTQNILNTLLAVEGGAALYKGGKSLVGGIGTLATGGTATGGAAMAAGMPFAAAAAAITGMTAAALSFVGFVRNASKYGLGGGAEVGGLTDTIATKEVQFGAAIARRLPRGGIGVFTGLQAMFGGVIGSEDALAKQQQAYANESGMAATRASQIQKLGAFQNRSGTTLDVAKRQLNDNYGLLQGLSAGGASGADVQAAYANVRQSMERVKQLSVEAARAQMEGSRDQLENLRHSHTLSKQLADESRRAYQSDIMKAATATPEEQMRLHEIARKRASGEQLNRIELDYAAQFNEFRPLVESQAEIRARELGLSDHFAASRKTYKDAEAKEAADRTLIEKLDLEVKQKHEFVIKLEQGEFSDKAMKEIDVRLKQIEAEMEHKLQQGLATFATRRVAR